MKQPQQHVAAVHFDAGAGAAVQRQLQVRIEFVMARIAPTHAGHSVDEITAEMLAQLRSLGVNAMPRQIEPYARTLSALPEAVH